jgi:hypothetical protein
MKIDRVFAITNILIDKKVLSDDEQRHALRAYTYDLIYFKMNLLYDVFSI